MRCAARRLSLSPKCEPRGDLSPWTSTPLKPASTSLRPRATITVRASLPGGESKAFPARVRIDTPVELDYYKNGGILQTVLRKLLKAS